MDPSTESGHNQIGQASVSTYIRSHAETTLPQASYAKIMSPLLEYAGIALAIVEKP